MSWSLNTNEVDLGFVNPTAGRKRYKIKEMKLAVDKDKQEYIQLAITDGKMQYSVPFWVMSKDETSARIANQGVAKLAIAAGITGALKPERLKSFAGKEVEIEFKNSKCGKYVNFANAYPVEDKKEKEEPDSGRDPSDVADEESEAHHSEGKKKAPWDK